MRKSVVCPACGVSSHRKYPIGCYYSIEDDITFLVIAKAAGGKENKELLALKEKKESFLALYGSPPGALKER